jgi:hypothetical protein
MVQDRIARWRWKHERWLGRTADRISVWAGYRRDEWWQKNLDERIQNYGADSQQACMARNFYAKRLSRNGRWEECRALRQANVEACLRREGANALSTLYAQSYLSVSLWRTGRREEARDLLREVIRIGEQVLPAKHKLLRNDRVLLATMERSKP